MNSFGLGLVLNFVDNASSGMNTATNNFMRMSATADSLTSSVSASATELASIAFSLGAVGDTFVSIGESITGVFAGITQQVINTGTEMQGYRMQLSALYGSVEAGEAKIEEIKQYAMSSVFDIQSLIPAVTMMKAVGIEAMSEVTTSSGNATQKLLDYASDIAAMVPNMRNTYGTGVQAAMGAIKEYIAEGNAMSLKRGAGLDITGILGEDKGASIEERTQQVADLVEKLNIVGYTASLAGTPTQRLSNMQDALFNSLSKIADSGVFEVYCGLLEKLSNWVFSLVENEETFNTITGVLADTITTILSPLESMLDWVTKNSDAIIAWVQEHPKLTKNILVTVAAIGAFLVVGGSLLKLLSSIAFASTGFTMLKSLPSILSRIGVAFKALAGKALPFVALAAIAYFVWKNNLFGIRDVAEGVMKDLGVIFSLVSDAWDDNALSEENFLKAKELGILPLIESLLQLKYYWSFFTEGFSKGFKSFFEGIAKSLSFLKLFGIDIMGLASKVGTFLKGLLGIGQEDNWEKIGDIVGKFAGLALSIFTVIKALTLLKSVSAGLGVVGKLSPIARIFGKTGSGSSASGGGGLLSNPMNTLKTMGSIGIIIGGIALIIGAYGALAKVPGFNDFMSNGAKSLAMLFTNILPIAAGAGVLSLLVAGLSKLKVSPTSAKKGIASLAIILGGFDVLVIAVGALSSIPGFNDFISRGSVTLHQLFNAMEVFSTPEFYLMTAAIAALGVLGVATIALGLAGLATIIAGFGLIISAFAALSMIEGFDEFIQSGGKTLALLFEQIGLAVGSIIGGFAEGITNSLPAIGSNISAFAENLVPFFDVCKTAPVDEIGEFLLAITGFIIGMGANEVLSFITGGVDYVALGNQLSDFGSAVAPFFDSCANYSDSGLEKAPKVFQALSSVGDYSFRSGGVAQFFTGEVNLPTIGKQLAEFAPHGEIFFNTVANYSDAGLEKSPKVFEALAGIGDYDFKTGGVAQFFTGETSLDVIGRQLASFAPNGLIFFNTVADYSEDGLQKSSEVFSVLAGIGDYNFKTGGVAQFFTGETRLDIIGTQLAGFASNGLTFFNTVANYSEDGLTKSKQVFEALSSIGKYEFKSGGLAQLFTGGTDLEGMGTQLSKFGDRAKDFFTTAADYSDKGLENGRKAIDILAVVGESGLQSGGLVSLFTGSLDIVSIGEQLSSFGAKAYNYFSSVEPLSDKAINNGKRVIEALEDLGNSTFRSGGLLQVFTGSVDISNLANNLSNFGKGSKTFFTVADALSYSSFNKAKQVFSALSEISKITNFLPSLSGNTLSSFGEELVLFIGSVEQFFVKSETLNVDSVQKVTGALSPFFDTVTAFDVSKLSTLSKGLDTVSTSTTGLAENVNQAVTDITNGSTAIVSALTVCKDDSLVVLSDFSAKGSTYGKTLMQNIASAITANAYLITNAVQKAVNSVTISIPNIATNASNQARSQVRSRGSLVGLDTGGYVKTTGLAVLHPNEVVVNDDTTKRLQNFLGKYDSDTVNGVSRDITQPQAVLNNIYPTVMEAVPVAPVPAETVASVNNNSSFVTNTQNFVQTSSAPQIVEKTGETKNDYSVTFAAGSIVIQLANTSDSELEKSAEKIMKIIARKQQLRAMAVRA